MKKLFLLSVIFFGVSLHSIAQQKAPSSKGSQSVVPDYKKPASKPMPKSDKPTEVSAPTTANTTHSQHPIKKSPAIPANSPSLNNTKPKGTSAPTRGIDPKTTATKPQQGPKPAKGSDAMVPDYKKPTPKPVGIGNTKPTTTGKPATGGVKPAPKPAPAATGGVKPATKPLPKNNVPSKTTLQPKSKSGSQQIVPDYKNTGTRKSAPQQPK